MGGLVSRGCQALIASVLQFPKKKDNHIGRTYRFPSDHILTFNIPRIYSQEDTKVVLFGYRNDDALDL